MARSKDCPPCPPCNPAPARDAPKKARARGKVPASAKPFQPAALSLPPKGPAVQTQSVQHGNIVPVSSYKLRGCCTKPAGAKVCNGPPRPGQVELVFPSRADATKFGVPLGPALQFCTGLREGTFVPMKDPMTAKKAAEAHVACVEGGEDVGVCITKTKGLSGLRAPRRRRPSLTVRRGVHRRSRR